MISSLYKVQHSQPGWSVYLEENIKGPCEVLGGQKSKWSFLQSQRFLGVKRFGGIFYKMNITLDKKKIKNWKNKRKLIIFQGKVNFKWLYNENKVLIFHRDFNWISLCFLRKWCFLCKKNLKNLTYFGLNFQKSKFVSISKFSLSKVCKNIWGKLRTLHILIYMRKNSTIM